MPTQLVEFVSKWPEVNSSAKTDHAQAGSLQNYGVSNMAHLAVSAFLARSRNSGV